MVHTTGYPEEGCPNGSISSTEESGGATAPYPAHVERKEGAVARPFPQWGSLQAQSPVRLIGFLRSLSNPLYSPTQESTA